MKSLRKDAKRGGRIKGLREDKGLSQEELARRVAAIKGASVSRGAIGNWERGLGLTIDNLEALAEALDVDSHWLLTGRQKLSDEFNVTIGPDILKERVPVISWVQAGAFTEVTDPTSDEGWVSTTTRVSVRSFALIVRGDSMEPEFPEGSIVVCDPEISPQPGDFVIARNGDNEATFKKLVKDGSDWYLKPNNPQYPMKPLGNSKIVAVAREMVRKLR